MDAREILQQAYEHSEIVSMVCQTTPEMRRTGEGGEPCPWPKNSVLHIFRVSWSPRASYRRIVQREVDDRYEDQDFRPTGRANGSTRIPGTPFAATAKGRLLVRVPRPTAGQEEYRDAETGVEIPAAAVAPWRRERFSRTQAEAGLWAADDQIEYRDIGIDRIIQIRVGGREYNFSGSVS